MKLGKAVIVASIGYAAYKALGNTDTERSANFNKANIDYSKLAAAIANDITLAAKVRGETGATGATGETGAAGNDGNDGDAIRAFGESLVSGTANETGVSGWSKGVLGDYHNQNKSLILASAEYAISNASFKAKKNALYLVSFKYKTLGSSFLMSLRTFTALDVFVSDKSAQGASVLGNDEWNEYKGYITTEALTTGQDGKQKLVIGCTAESVEFADLIIEEATDAVPYTLPWLPAGQMIVDPATGDVGRWDGTAETWFATV